MPRRPANRSKRLRGRGARGLILKVPKAARVTLGDGPETYNRGRDNEDVENRELARPVMKK